MEGEKGLDRGTVLTLIAMGLSTIIIAADFSAMNVALPEIQRSFGSKLGVVEWVINAYALVFGVLIVTGGRLADMFGRRRIFFIGTAIFASMSFVGGIAQTDYWLIGARALMGIGGAMMWPSILGITFAALPDNKAGLAGGIILGTAGLGQAMGPIWGGVLTELLSWRWIQFINLPIAASAVLITWFVVQQSADIDREKKIDYLGIITLSIGLLSFLFAIDQATAWGWGNWSIIGSLIISVILIIAFVFVERRMGMDALVPPDIIKNRGFVFACITILFVSTAFFAALLYIPLYIQNILDYSVLKTGLGVLPMMLLFGIVSFVAGKYYEHFGARLIVSVGTASMALGTFLISFAITKTGYFSLVPGLVLLGLGMGLFYSTITTAAVTSLDPSRTSLAGGIIYMFQIAGGALGLGITTTIFISSSRGFLGSEIEKLGVSLTDAQQSVIHGILAGIENIKNAQESFNPELFNRIISMIHDAFIHGLEDGFTFAGASALVSFVIALLFVGRRYSSN